MMNLRKLRIQRNLTLEQLSEELGTSKQVLSRYELGQAEPSYKVLLQIAHYFDVSVDYLLGNSTYYYPDGVGVYSNSSAVSSDAEELLALYQTLSPTRKEDLKIFLRALSEQSAAEPAPKFTPKKKA